MCHHSQKSSRDATPATSATPVTTTTPDVSGSDPMSSNSFPGGSGEMTYGSASEDGSGVITGSESGTTTTAMLQDGSWLAGLAMGASSSLQPTLVVVLVSAIFSILFASVSL